MSTLPKLETNPRGIPQAPFIDNVEAHVGGADVEIESTLRQFQEAIAKYRYMEMNLNQRKKGLLEKIPDIEKTLSMVKFLRDQKEGHAEEGEDDDDLEEKTVSKTITFELNDTLFAEAEIDPACEVVYLWLGANVMLSYTHKQAIDLLSGKLASAQLSLSNAVEDLEFLREQITVMEVNTARCYNWDIKRRRDARLAAQAVTKA